MTIRPTIALANGVEIPRVGFGTFRVDTAETQQVVEQALEAGYRHIDTAAAYRNEAGVGAALRASGLRRGEVFVTTKLRNGDQGYESALRAFERLYDEGAVRAIGVSNFLPEHLDRLQGAATVVPMVNQVEIHPTCQQIPTQEASRQQGITVEAYGSIGRGEDLSEPVVVRIAAAHQVSPAQVVLRWHLQQGRVVISTSVTPQRIVSNLDILGFDLSDAEMADLTGLERGRRLYPDPREAAFSQK